MSDTPAPGKAYRPFLLGILFVSLFLSYLVLKSFLHAIVLSLLLASSFQPLQQRLLRAYRGRKNAAAFTVLAGITFLIIIPIFIFVSALVKQGISSVNAVNDWIQAGNLQKLLADSEGYTSRLLKELTWLRQFDFDLRGHLIDMTKGLGQFLLGQGAQLVGDLFTLVSTLLIVLFLTFYVLRDGKAMLEYVKKLSPLREEQENRIIEKVRDVGRSALLGNLLTAVLQGAVGGIGLAIVGIPALFWGTLMGLSSMIPWVGTALVWFPAVVYLVLTAQWKAALFLALWSILAVGTVDNFARPFLMKGRTTMSPFFIFLAIIGGIKHFGLIGILYGPLILGFAAVMLYVYQAEYQELLEPEGESEGSR